MATKTLGSNYWTFRDFASGRLPNGNFDPDVINMIAENNPFMQDILWKECLKGGDDVTTIKTGMPTATLRAFYEGIKPSKSAKKQVTNSCATVSSMLRFDWRLFQRQKDKAAFLKDEQGDHTEVVTAGVAKLLFYGDTKETPKAINGFATTFGEYAPDSFTDDKKSMFYCLNAAHGSGASSNHLRSLWLVGWGRKSAYAIYPEGTNCGIEIGQLTEQYDDDETSEDGKKMKWGIQEFNQDCGLTVKDFRYSGRICNIDIGRAMEKEAPDYTEYLRRLACRCKADGASQHFYMCRHMFEVLSVQFARKTQENAIKYADMQQKLPAAILGIPVSFNDVLNTDEAAVPQVGA